MLVAEKEHERHRIVKLVHLLEIRHLIEIADVEHGKVLDTVGDPYGGASQKSKQRTVTQQEGQREGEEASQALTVEHFILAHTVGIPVTSEAYHHQAFFFRQDGLVYMPVWMVSLFFPLREGDGASSFLPAGDQVG